MPQILERLWGIFINILKTFFTRSNTYPLYLLYALATKQSFCI